MSWKERVEIVVGDIAESDAEAVVNAANNELWMGSGVAGALKRAGGVAIEQEAVGLAPIAIGESVITGAGELKALHVIHAAAMGSGRPATAESVQAATRSALRVAVENNIDTIAMPALGTGVGGLSLDICALEMLSTAKVHSAEHAQPEKISFVLFGNNAADIFNTVLAGMDA